MLGERERGRVLGEREREREREREEGERKSALLHCQAEFGAVAMDELQEGVSNLVRGKCSLKCGPAGAENNFTSLPRVVCAPLFCMVGAREGGGERRGGGEREGGGSGQT